MKRDKKIESLAAEVRYRSSDCVRTRIRSRLDGVWQRHLCERGGGLVRVVFGGHTIANLSKLAVITLLLIAGGVWIIQINRSTGSAYALEQTADAVREIRYFHFQFILRPKKPAREAWVEYDANDSIRNVRVNFYDQNSVMVWSEDTTQYWNQNKHEIWVFEDDEYTEKILYFVQRHDPRQAIAYLQQRAEQSGIQIHIDQPQASTDPVTVTVTYDPNTYLIGKAQPHMREFYRIDPLTKLITSVDVEALADGRYMSKGAWEYIDYNWPFDPNIFDLKGEASPDVSWSDTTGIAMGVEQGGLSDEEVAVKLVREFLDAWAAKDYDRAAQLHGYAAMGETKGLTAVLSKRNVLQVVSLGPLVRAEPPLRGLFVPGEVEYEENGQKAVMHLRTHVSQYAQGRWRIRDIGMRP